MTQPAVGQTVQYFTHQTREKGPNRGPHGPKLAQPIPIGPCAALVTEVRPDGKLNLVVWMPNGHMYPAFGVTQEPTTPVLHMWRPVPVDTLAQETAFDRIMAARVAAVGAEALREHREQSKAKLDTLIAATQESVVVSGEPDGREGPDE